MEPYQHGHKFTQLSVTAGDPASQCEHCKHEVAQASDVLPGEARLEGKRTLANGTTLPDLGQIKEAFRDQLPPCPGEA